jgi:hypothetical protein
MDTIGSPRYAPSSDDSFSMETQRCSNLVGVFTTGQHMVSAQSSSQDLEKKMMTTSADSIRCV